MNSKDILSRVFEITRDPRDGLLFLQEFKSLSPESFALLFADSETILESSEALFSDIKLLHQLDLFPVVVLEENSYHYLKLFFNTEHKSDGGESKFGIGFPFQIIVKRDDLLSDVKTSIEKKKIPILIWNPDKYSFVHFLEQTRAILKSNKIIIVDSNGPIRDEKTGKIVSMIAADSSLDEFQTKENLSPKEKQFLSLASHLVPSVSNPKFSVVLTYAYTLLRELFTVKGSGTLVKRKNKVGKYTDFHSVDSRKVFDLIESSFSKKLKPSFLESKFDLLYLEESYWACAWLQKTEFGHLLSKFAVNEIARGAGVGRDIWDLLLEENTPLFWRSKTNNNINKWYMQIAQGVEKDENWFYYWLGQDYKNIPGIIDYLKNLPEDFYPAPLI
ncbi:acetylglutamate kinase [Leptospira idonii]|uniref:Acetylglutamate kinase n=1 Tax=Leptospira idonii TaxID=1193500 RepID=A0A4R9M099_9LEPT|nr:acetylglutamate kinase [Leptospira idonii]TGN18649.1 acetylglutamate kinase [Leptospira idonii]